MDSPQTISILLPCHSLEDFPTFPHDRDAESLLAAWTAGWHPECVATARQIPAWHRAEVPPQSLDNQIFLVPTLSSGSLPNSFAKKLENSENARRIEVETRSQALSELGVDPKYEAAARDFFALGYTYLQIQLMTRQLRYSTNLDEVYFEQQVATAAEATVAGDAASAREALQKCFDCLAEERDHYFSGDPHLIDLTLLADTCLGQGLDAVLADQRPQNLLLSADLAEQLARENPAAARSVASRIAEKSLSLAGGTGDDRTAMGLWTTLEMDEELRRAAERYRGVLNATPRIYGRFAGGHAARLPGPLSQMGYLGAIIADFAQGQGSKDDEPKLLWESAGATIECLAGPPLDAGDPHWLLAVGVRLGEAIDSGHVPTALFAHWPGATCDAFDDLRIAATWGLALGQFRTLEDYFESSERPFHSLYAAPPSGGDAWLGELMSDAGGAEGGLAAFAARYREKIAAETNQTLVSMARLIAHRDPTPEKPPQELIAAALADAQGPRDSTSVVNPHSSPVRAVVHTNGMLPAADCLYFSDSGSPATSLVDTPAIGFVRAVPEEGRKGRSLFSRKPRSVVEGDILRNEFLEAAVDPETGTLASVYLVGTRSNRLSVQLARRRERDYTTMEATRVEIVHASPTVGRIRAHGRLVDQHGETAGDFDIVYQLQRGSRVIELSGELNVAPGAAGENPWRNYTAIRTAWASAAGTVHAMRHDSLYPVTGRKIVAPLGYFVDESDHRFSFFAGGFPAHVRREDRMMDTLLASGTAREVKFAVGLGFDVPSPIHGGRLLCAPIGEVPLPASGSQPTLNSGWLLYPSSDRLLINRVQIVSAANDSETTLAVDVTESKGRALAGRIHTFRPLESAAWAEDSGADDVRVEDGAASLRLAAHQSGRLILRLRSEPDVADK